MDCETVRSQHKMRRHYVVLALIMPALLSFAGCSKSRPDVRVAVASNFSFAITELVAQFETETGYNVTLSFGSTGLHYAQITHGAPYDVFFAADSERPARLEKEDLAVRNSRFTYALGKLVLWSPSAKSRVTSDSVLLKGDFRHLAIANPKLAPYGRAAREMLLNLNIWDQLDDRIVRGENVGQAFHYVQSGNAEWGLVARSLVSQTDPTPGSIVWEVPQSLYSPIEQQAILLVDSHPARELISFVQSDRGRSIIRAYGYDTP